MPDLPFVEKPTFNIGRIDREGFEITTFDALRTAAYLSDRQVDECCALFFGWRYDQKEDKYTDSKGRERSMWWEAWLNPKGKGTYRLGLDEVKPPKFRTTKWGEVLAYCVEQGWEPCLKVYESEGQYPHACILKPIEHFPMCKTKGDAICRSFLAAAWTLQDAREEAPNA